MEPQLSGTLAVPTQLSSAKRQGDRGWLESTGRFGDWLLHGRVRHVDSRFHARNHLLGPQLEQLTSRVACNVDFGWCGGGWSDFWNLERPFRSNSDPYVDDSGFRRSYVSLCFRTWLLGPGRLPNHCWSRHRRQTFPYKIREELPAIESQSAINSISRNFAERVTPSFLTMPPARPAVSSCILVGFVLVFNNR
jgi:hypothetical protein